MHLSMNLEEGLMTFMIRRIILVLAIFFPQACQIELGYIDLFREALKGNEIIVDNKLKESIPASFLKASKGKYDAIYVLSSSVNTFDTWIGADGSKIITFRGIIIKTIGLEHDIDILNKDNVTSRFGYSSFRLLVNLSNPELKFADTQFHYYPILEEGNNCEREFEYEREIELINFKSKDWYCYNDNKIYLSRQKLNPFDNEMTLEFHYKY